MIVVELLGGFGGEVVEVLVGPFGVEPHHPFSRGDLGLVDVAPGDFPADEFALERADGVSANALSTASPNEPTEGSTPSSMSCWVTTTEVYCPELKHCYARTCHLFVQQTRPHDYLVDLAPAAAEQLHYDHRRTLTMAV